MEPARPTRFEKKKNMLANVRRREQFHSTSARASQEVAALIIGRDDGERSRMRSSYDGAAVLAVHRSSGHTFSKSPQSAIRLLEGLGVEGDAHNGVTVKHRTLVRRDPSAPNLRQVHLIQCELFDELRPAGFTIAPDQIGENITTRGINLLTLPKKRSYESEAPPWYR
jgi:hypothetical protein